MENDEFYWEWSERYSDSATLSGQLRYAVHRRVEDLLFPVRKVADHIGIQNQILCRFLDDAEGEHGVETPTIELLWAGLDLCIYLDTGGRKFGRESGLFTFSDQLRAAIRQCGIRSSLIAKNAAISLSVLSLFLNGKRNGLSMGAYDRLWVYLGLHIGVEAYGDSSHGTHLPPDDPDDDLPF